LMIHQELEERKSYKSHLLIKALLKREVKNYALSVYKQTDKMNQLQTKVDIDFYYEQYLLGENYANYLELEKGRDSRDYLITLIQSLDTYYVARKLNLSVELLSVKTITGLEYNDVILRNIEHIISNPIFQENNFIKLYYFILQMFENEENEAAFHNLIELLDSPSAKTFHKADLNIFYTHAANYCMRKVRSGQPEFEEHLFSIFLAFIKYGFIYDGKFVRANRMKNIISVACQLGKMSWAKDFLNQYEKDLNPKIRASATQMFNAFISFYNKDFEDTLSHLAMMQEDIDSLYFLNTRTFQLRCYYELSESNAFYNLRNTFLDYLRSTKKNISGAKKKSHTNFTKIAYMLYRKKDGLSKKPIVDIRQKIESSTALELRPWLLEKCDELNG